MAKKKLKCVWNMGTPCDGEVQEMKLFEQQIEVPMCESHLEQHKEVMILHKNGYDVEEVLQETPEYRRREVLTLKLSGLDTDDVEI